MNKFLLSAAAAAIAVTATPAAAQVAPSGARAEVLAGFDRVKLDVGDDFFDVDGNVLGNETAKGLMWGFGAGYDFPVGNSFSIGADAEVSFSTSDISFYDEDFNIYNLEAGRDFYAGLRGTFAVAPTTNVYLKAGYTNARFRIEELGSDNEGGWRVGAGVQQALNRDAYIGAEYRYSTYNSDVKRHQLVATLGVRFWQPALAVAPAPVVEAPAPAPATQTCPDGSVILATDACPAPAPVPAPPPAGERG